MTLRSSFEMAMPVALTGQEANRHQIEAVGRKVELYPPQPGRELAGTAPNPRNPRTKAACAAAHAPPPTHARNETPYVIEKSDSKRISLAKPVASPAAQIHRIVGQKCAGNPASAHLR